MYDNLHLTRVCSNVPPEVMFDDNFVLLETHRMLLEHTISTI
jgi:hypothetical protein